MSLESGSINGDAGYVGFYIRIDWWENSTSVSENKSNVGVNIVLYVPSGYQTTSTMSGSYTINGTTYTFSKGSQQYGRGPATYTLASWSGDITHDADGRKSIGLSATVTSGWSSLGTMPTASGTAVLSQLATVPSGFTNTIVSVGKKSAALSGTVADYGSPVGADRYVLVAVLGSSTYGEPYRYVQSAAGATSLTNVTVANNVGSGSLTIAPNTKYYAATYASNGMVGDYLIGDSFITLPGDFTSLSCTNEGDTVTAVWAREAEGNAATVTKQYSLDNGTTWTTFTSNPFTFRATGSGTLKVRAVNSTGSSAVKSASYEAQASHLYGSVNSTSKLLNPVYVGVSGVAKKIIKLYIGDQNGVARKVIG